MRVDRRDDSSIVVIGVAEIVGGILIVRHHEQVDEWYQRRGDRFRGSAALRDRGSRRNGYVLILIGSLAIVGAALLLVFR
jgi:hypothetical protein